MNEYESHQEKNTVANEAWVAYNAHLADIGKMSVLGSALMDELLHQSDEIKLLIINKLSESMIINKLSESMIRQKDAEKTENAAEASKRKEIEAKLDELHVTGSLRRLFGAAPFIDESDDWKKEKETYLMSKYGI